MSSGTEREEITALLLAHGRGEDGSLDRLVERVYDDLRRIARSQLRRNVRGTLDTTGLVNEAYIRLVDGRKVSFEDRGHFFAVASQVMRWVVVDRARKVSAQKRGGNEADVTLDEGEIVIDAQAERLLDLDRALDSLSQVDPRLTKIVECRFFAGLSLAESAEALGISPRTANRDWARAKAWLLRDLRDSGQGEGAGSESR